MSEPLVAPNTYRFSTLQELVDTVPTDRIMDCMHELAVTMTEAKAMSELVYAMAVEIAKKDGVDLPVQTREEGMVFFRVPFEWIDDGKGSLETHFNHPVTGEELFRTNIQLNVKEENQDTTGGS